MRVFVYLMSGYACVCVSDVRICVCVYLTSDTHNTTLLITCAASKLTVMIMSKLQGVYIYICYFLPIHGAVLFGLVITALL